MAAREAQLLYSEALTVRARARLGLALCIGIDKEQKGAATAASEAGSSSAQNAHWSESNAKERLHEVMGRMNGEGAMLEKLLLTP